MEENGLISVIVPVYKVEKYLDQCVSSIVNQTYKNLEIILVDDGSPDNCPAMCDAWAEKDSRIRVIHKENGGLSQARNVGLALATGEYIGFVDSDDWIAADMYECLLSTAHKYNCQIAACDVCFVAEGDTPPETKAGELRICGSEEALEDLTQGSGFRAVAWNKLYRRDVLDGIRFPVGRLHEDEFVTYKALARAAQLAFVNTPMYFYLQRQGSIMSTFDARHLDALDAYWERLCFLQENYPALWLPDKCTFCISCVMLYNQIRDNVLYDGKQSLRKIRSLRKQVRFTLRELKRCTWKQRVYILGTRIWMNGFCALIGVMRSV